MRAIWIVASLGLVGASGCGGSGAPVGNDNSGGTGCAALTSGAQVAFDTDSATPLTATAVTADCDEVAVFEDGQGVVIVSGDSTLQAEFDDNGQLIAARSDDGETLSASYNDDLSYARVAYEDDANNSSSNIVEVSRDAAGAARVVTGNGTELAFCSQLRQFAGLAGSGCDGANPPPYCSGSFAAGRAAAERLCNASSIAEVQGVGVTTAASRSPTLPLGISGYATTRLAAGSGTTIILTSVGFGGARPYTVRWAQTSGPTAPISTLPGGAAVADAPTSTGVYDFTVTISDAAGAMASAPVRVELGDSGFVGVVIQANPALPVAGQAVTFRASGVSPTTAVLWDFGDGTRGTGAEVTHAYAINGAYLATVVQGSGASVLIDTLEVLVGGASVARGPAYTLQLDLGGSNVLDIGERRTIRAVVQGAVGRPDVAIGLVGELSVAQMVNADVVDAEEGVAVTFSDSATVQALAEGTLAVAAVAVDAAGRVLETVDVLSVCGDDGGLFALIDAPLELALEDAVGLEALVVSCTDDAPALTYSWLVSGNGTLSNPSASAPTLTATMPGVVVVELVVTDGSGHVARTAAEIDVTSGDSGLFIEYLGPFEAPIGVPVIPSGFVGGGVEPFFCAWASLDPVGLQFTDPFACETTFVVGAEGCFDAQVYVEDVRGLFGVAEFEVCSGEGNGTSPCPFDGFCDDDCPFVDPDCFESFCMANDFVCDSFCAVDDPDCNRCAADGVCILLCPQADPDCQRDFCVCGDGLCDEGCPVPDCDCSFGACVPDGRCDLQCNPVDPDCDGTNAEICLETDFCCVNDGLCDLDVCPEPDADCQRCGFDGVCIDLCEPFDPDCSTECDVSFGCDPNCPADPDCSFECDQTFDCDPNCPGDPDC